jgi:flagellar hook-associated protein 2
LQTAASALASTSVGSARKVVNESSGKTINAAVSSSTPVGSYKVQVTQLATASQLTGGAASKPGAGTLTINTKDITITDTMEVPAIVTAINAAGAGVTAIANQLGTQIVLTSQATGLSNTISISSGTTGMLRSLGLDVSDVSSGATLTSGADTKVKINGLEFTSADSTLNSSDHNIPGLSFNANKVMSLAEAETLTVSTDASEMRGKIDTFVSAYNAVADFIDSTTGYTKTAGKITAGPLADNREIQSWLGQLRSIAFRAPQSGSVKNLSSLGIDFTPFGKDSRILITDSTKLNAAIADHPSDVAAFFNTTNTGLASAFVTSLNTFIGADGSTGQLSTKLQSYTKANESLDAQIAALDAYLAQRRSQLEAGFMEMESAQSKIKQMQTQLTNSFGQKNSSQ